jgi:hypothetical protein
MSLTILHTSLVQPCYLVAVFYAALSISGFLYLYIYRNQISNQLSGNGSPAFLRNLVNQSIEIDIGKRLSSNNS